MNAMRRWAVPLPAIGITGCAGSGRGGAGDAAPRHFRQRDSPGVTSIMGSAALNVKVLPW
jgi:hypothetical protein